jgi:hypothetical protein
MFAGHSLPALLNVFFAPSRLVPSSSQQQRQQQQHFQCLAAAAAAAAYLQFRPPATALLFCYMCFHPLAHSTQQQRAALAM